MMFNKFTVLAALAVILLAVSAYGHPPMGNGAAMETTTAEDRSFRGWMSGLSRSVHDHISNYRHMDGSVFQWAKNKLGFGKATSTSTTAPLAPETTAAPKVTPASEVATEPKTSVATEPKASVAPKATKAENHNADEDTDDEAEEGNSGASETVTASKTSVPKTENHDADEDTDDETKNDNSAAPETVTTSKVPASKAENHYARDESFEFNTPAPASTADVKHNESDEENTTPPTGSDESQVTNKGDNEDDDDNYNGISPDEDDKIDPRLSTH